MFESLTRVPPDPILGVSAAFQKDPSTDKVDLGVGVYKDEAGKTPVPRAVRRAEQDLIAAQTTKAYLSPVGNPGFNTQVAALTFGGDLAGLHRIRDALAVPDRKSTRLNSSHIPLSRMPSSA